MFVEVPVHADSAPYVVTSNKGLIWINNPFKGGFVRSAVLRTLWADVEAATLRSVVTLIKQRGTELSWGNSFPNTPQGVKDAEAYLKSYDLDAPDLIVSDDGPNAWIPKGSAVMVPKDRSYFGVVGLLDNNTHTVVIHNPSRGLAVLGDW